MSLSEKKGVRIDALEQRQSTMSVLSKSRKSRKASIRLTMALIVISLTSPSAVPCGPETWDREAAQKEMDGMRRYARAVWGATAAGFKHKPRDQPPAVHAFLEDFDVARKAVDPQKAPREWPSVDLDALAIRNPRYWAAVYELEPAAPLMMLFHASLHGVNGEVAATFYSQLLAARSPSGTPKDFSRLIDSSARLISMGDRAVQAGVKFHDREEYDEAEKVFRDVLRVIPSHSLALYELGNTLRKKDRGEAGKQAARSHFDRAKRVDPFRIEAYQGSFRGDEIRQFFALRSQAKPAWDAFMHTSRRDGNAEQLQKLSSHLQAAGIYELGLLVRQLVVASRGASYNEEDVQFIRASLKALMPEEDLSDVIRSLTDD